MRRTLVAGVVAVLCLFSGTGPAGASHDSGDCGSGGCGNEREEQYGDGSCKYVCPAFDKSPVQDSFNFGPVICLPGSTCNVDRDKDKPQ